ncbi:Glutathione gamma-glutamylcysteinyltransferase 3 [Gracilariopsis chorda]|uniref:glutathione gamma-glutamylcysteinyltransferase n=1 Tax=Gracilariopsis chorda TaxID=448386 RepID=A0A2V3J6P5_9FLOR|nr:Glutathione gamma-glutamylcysteinyltransferase 3 [Gracilariopsis chorda]|eukprot:PXF50098.1 Glutathione gamma-glutamylcysteinyltransferase 3 [Gracilariopsis chorda]
MESVKKEGISMNQLARIAKCQGTSVQVLRRLNVSQTRQLIKKSVKGNPDGSFEFVAASYDRKTLGQTGTGHFSPVAAYDPQTDSVLVLDVARFKYGPHWVPIEDLVAATMPLDPATGLPRGFMTFRKIQVNREAAPEKCILQSCTEKCKNEVEVQ